MHAKREYGSKKFIKTEFYFHKDEILEKKDYFSGKKFENPI